MSLSAAWSYPSNTYHRDCKYKAAMTCCFFCEKLLRRPLARTTLTLRSSRLTYGDCVHGLSNRRRHQRIRMWVLGHFALRRGFPSDTSTRIRIFIVGRFYYTTNTAFIKGVPPPYVSPFLPVDIFSPLTPEFRYNRRISIIYRRRGIRRSYSDASATGCKEWRRTQKPHGRTSSACNRRRGVCWVSSYCVATQAALPRDCGG